mgnify:FL=1
MEWDKLLLGGLAFYIVYVLIRIERQQNKICSALFEMNQVLKSIRDGQKSIYSELHTVRNKLPPRVNIDPHDDSEEIID